MSEPLRLGDVLASVRQGAEIIEYDDGAGRQTVLNGIQSADLGWGIVHVDVGEADIFRQLLGEAFRRRTFDNPDIWEAREPRLHDVEQLGAVFSRMRAVVPLQQPHSTKIARPPNGLSRRPHHHGGRPPDTTT